ncbi:hypothetical protein AUC68_09170 [Methyloceanibacter methanicus]|uniref:Uncharacterized protein n=1 Tax=Methyloceanibacter methanicus TaxID=1774968 RepID=A0A1E3W091_9HYPH|nr:hypothetical protein AUC68_09170 [Methyloceanibacter methanicus]
MQLDARNRGFERRGTQVEQTRRARADQKNAPGDLFFAEFAVQDLPGRQVAIASLRRDVEKHLAVGVGRNLEVADTHLHDSGLLAEGFSPLAPEDLTT